MLLLLYAVALALIVVPSAELADPQYRIAIAVGGFLLSLIVAIAVGVIVHRRRATETRQLQAAHAVLDRAAALVEERHRPDDSPSTLTLNFLVERLDRLVRGVHRLVDERRQREREVMPPTSLPWSVRWRRA
jgi:hypothetical protein